MPDVRQQGIDLVMRRLFKTSVEENLRDLPIPEQLNQRDIVPEEGQPKGAQVQLGAVQPLPPPPPPPPPPQAELSPPIPPAPEFVRKGDFVAQYYKDKGWKQLHRGTATTEEIRADISKLAEASEAYGKIYGAGEELRSAGLEAVGFVPVAGTIIDWERMTPIERGISIAVDTAILAIPAIRGAKAGLNQGLKVALNQGLDKWIATQARILPEAQSGLYKKITAILGEKSNWLTEKATQNLIKN